MTRDEDENSSGTTNVNGRVFLAIVASVFYSLAKFAADFFQVPDSTKPLLLVSVVGVGLPTSAVLYAYKGPPNNTIRRSLDRFWSPDLRTHPPLLRPAFYLCGLLARLSISLYKTWWIKCASIATVTGIVSALVIFFNHSDPGPSIIDRSGLLGLSDGFLNLALVSSAILASTWILASFIYRRSQLSDPSARIARLGMRTLGEQLTPRAMRAARDRLLADAKKELRFVGVNAHDFSEFSVAHSYDYSALKSVLAETRETTTTIVIPDPTSLRVRVRAMLINGRYIERYVRPCVEVLLRAQLAAIKQNRDRIRVLFAKRMPVFRLWVSGGTAVVQSYPRLASGKDQPAWLVRNSGAPLESSPKNDEAYQHLANLASEFAEDSEVVRPLTDWPIDRLRMLGRLVRVSIDETDDKFGLLRAICARLSFPCKGNDDTGLVAVLNEIIKHRQTRDNRMVDIT